MSRFKTELAVSMQCQDCVQSIRNLLKNLHDDSRGLQVDRFDIDLENQTVIIEGNVPPSILTRALRDSGREVIVRGVSSNDAKISQMQSDGLGTAVCILETPFESIDDGSKSLPDLNNQDPSFSRDLTSSYVHGLVRMIQINENLCMFDVTVQNLTPGVTHKVWIGSSGDVTRGIASIGPQYGEILGTMIPDVNGWANLMIEKEDFKVWDIIGRSIAVQIDDEHLKRVTSNPSIVTELVGTIARSAGVWENTKKVCGCTGRTLWEEHLDLKRIRPQASL